MPSCRHRLFGSLEFDALLRSLHASEIQRLLRLLQPPPRFQRARYGPGLRRSAARRVRGCAVEHFAHRTERRIQQMIAQRLETPLCRRCISAHAILGKRIVSEQERPHRPLVVAAIALPHAAEVLLSKLAMCRCQAAQSIRSEQIGCARAHYTLLRLRIECAVRQTHGEDLIRAQRRVEPSGAVDYVVQPFLLPMMKRWKPSAMRAASS